MILSDSDVRSFQEQGYLAVPGFFDEQETRAMQQEVRRWRRQGLLDNVSAAGHKVAYDIGALFRLSRLFRALPFHERATASMGQLLGGPTVLHNTGCFYKVARDGRGTGWHADGTYYDITNPWLAAAMWIAVDDATVENGTLHVLPRSVCASVPYDSDPITRRRVARLEPEHLRHAVPVPLKAGGVVFFSYGTLHCTLDNTTHTDRAAVSLHFFHEQLFHPYFPWDELPHPYLTGPRAVGGAPQFGMDLRGTWPREVSRVLEGEPREVSRSDVLACTEALRFRIQVRMGNTEEEELAAGVLIPVEGRPSRYELPLYGWELELFRAIDGVSTCQEVLELLKESNEGWGEQQETRALGLMTTFVAHGALRLVSSGS